MTTHVSTCPGSCPVSGSRRGSQDQLVHTSQFIHQGTEVQRYKVICSESQSVMTAEAGTGQPAAASRYPEVGERWPQDQSPGTAPQPRSAWVVCNVARCARCIHIPVSHAVAVLGSCLPSWAASRTISSPRDRSLGPWCDVGRAGLRGARRVPGRLPAPPARHQWCGFGPYWAEKDQPFPRCSEMLVENWLLSGGVTNWPLSQYGRKTSPAETEPFCFRGGELGQRGTMALATEQVLNDF